MAALSFVPKNEIVDFLTICWGVSNANSLAGNALGAYNITVSNGSFLVSQTEADGIPVVMTIDIIDDLISLLIALLPRITGYCIFAAVFGISFTASLLALYYLLKNWRNTPSHFIVTGFTFVISAFNVALFAVRSASTVASVQNVICPLFQSLNNYFAFMPQSIPPWKTSDERIEAIETVYHGFSLSIIPVFIWVSDAFLIYRAWVIWIYHRNYTAIPAVAYLASIVAGIIWVVQDSAGNRPSGSLNLARSVDRWIPALGFSCGLDTLTTGMIAGRLIYHHWNHRKLNELRTSFYVPVMTIFIESAALSLIAKILQISLLSLANNPLVVPLCTISSNLIVLRKALGADIVKEMARKRQKRQQGLSEPRFRDPDPNSTNANDGSIPGGFESHLIQTIGGHLIELDSSNSVNIPIPKSS